MSRPRLLDLYCGQGGAAMGYHRAGFDVVGVDLANQRRYPFTFHQGDAIAYLLAHWHEYDAIHASPPCQLYSVAANSLTPAQLARHPDLLPPTRAALLDVGRPYVIENVPGAPMNAPLTLCGTEFGLRATDTDGLRVWLKRHRLFESNVFLWGAGGCCHPANLYCAGIYGNGSPTHQAAKQRAGGYTPASYAVRKELMGIDWMTRDGLSQAIPPAYTQHIGEQLIEALAHA